MKKLILFLFILFFSSKTQLFAQNKISSSVLQGDNFKRTFPQPYYDSIKGELIHPPYTDPKTGITYKFKDVYVDRDPYMGEYLYCYDDKIEPFGWSNDSKLYFAIHNYGYYEEGLEMPTQYFLVDVSNNSLLFYDTIQNKNLQKRHHIKINAELKQFPLKIMNNRGTLIEKIDITNSLHERDGNQSLTFSSTKKGEILIKSSENMPDFDLGCPDEVKGYFLSPDEKYLVAVFYSNLHITGAGGDPCEGTIYLKVLDVKKFDTIKKDKSFDEVITSFWGKYWSPENDTKEVVMTASDSLIALLFPNVDKDSLVNSIDSEIFSFFKKVKPIFTKSELKKLEKEKRVLYKELNDALATWSGSFNEESWKKQEPFGDVGVGDADDGRLFGEDVIGLINRLAEVSLGKEKEVYLKERPNLLSMIYHAECVNPCSEEINAMQELLRFQIQNEYNIQSSMESLNEIYIGKLNDLKDYIKKNKLDEWIDYYGNGKDIIYLKRLLDLCSSLQINALITNSNKFPGTDKYELTAHEETLIYNYPSYQITTVPHKETNGFVITIKNVKSGSSFAFGEEWGLYFQGLIGHYMIIDEGTGSIRNLSVHNLQEQKVVFKNGYVGSFEIIKRNIHFLDQVQLKKESEKPKCPQELIDIGYGIGYVEKLIYDIDKGKMKRTGEYQCWYFE